MNEPRVRRWANLSQVARYTGYSRNTIRNLIATGKLAAYRPGDRLIRIDLNDVDDMIMRGRIVPTDGEIAEDEGE